jgi:hypothetical protein
LLLGWRISLKNGLVLPSKVKPETAAAFMQNAKRKLHSLHKTELETDRYFPYLPIKNVANLITTHLMSWKINTKNGVNICEWIQS